MPHRVDLFISYKIMFFSFKNANVKMKVGIIVAGDKLELKPSTRAYIINTTLSYNRNWGKSANKSKIRTFTTIFLIQYFCLHGILPLSKSCPEIESP